MADKESFLQLVKDGYSFKGESFRIGTAVINGEVVPGADVLVPLRTMNRHGLIAGATGTGKTKTLQVISEGLSNASIPVLMMDIKGDLSGIAAAGTENDKIKDRVSKIGGTYKPAAYPVELLSLSNERGVRLRATVTEFGPIVPVLDVDIFPYAFSISLFPSLLIYCKTLMKSFRSSNGIL